MQLNPLQECEKGGQNFSRVTCAHNEQHKTLTRQYKLMNRTPLIVAAYGSAICRQEMTLFLADLGDEITSLRRALGGSLLINSRRVSTAALTVYCQIFAVNECACICNAEMCCLVMRPQDFFKRNGARCRTHMLLSGEKVQILDRPYCTTKQTALSKQNIFMSHRAIVRLHQTALPTLPNKRQRASSTNTAQCSLL